MIGKTSRMLGCLVYHMQADVFAENAYGAPALTKAAENGHCEVRDSSSE